MKVNISGKIFYVGVNDRKTHLFENMWPIPYGVSYNSYIIADEKTALVDTVEIAKSETFLKKVEIALDGRDLDYLIINHMEPDHGGSIRLIVDRYPNVKIVGNKKTFGMLDGYFGITENLHQVKEKDTLELGHHKLQFFMAPMVHWPEVMVTLDTTDKVLFSADAFGTFGTLDGGVIDSEINLDKYWDEMTRYYACIVGKYGNPVQKALGKLAGEEINYICSTHGPVWKDNIAKVVGMYDTMSKYETTEGLVIVYGSMYGNTEDMAEAVAQGAVAEGVKDVVIHDVSKSDLSDILRDIFKYKGLIIGSPTYSNELYPGVKTVVNALLTRGVKDHYFGCFGSFTWAGNAVKELTKFVEEIGWDLVGESVEQKMALKNDTYESCIELGKAMATKLQN